MAVKLLGDLSASGNATFNSEVNLPSNGQIDWANGDARIIEGAVTNYSLSFQTYTGSALTTKMFIQSGGNVGIGTTSPGYKLDVNGDFRAKDGSSAIAFNEYSNGATIWLDGSDGDFAGGDYFNISAYGTTDLAFGYGASTKITMKSDGKLGVGTANPLEKLHVVGKINSSNNIVSNSTYTMFTGRSSRTTDDYGGLNKEYFKANLVTPGPNTTGESSAHGIADLRFQLANSAGNTNMSDIMTLRSGGNVGIGTTSPAYRLDVAGTSRSDLHIFRSNQSAPTADAFIFRPADNTVALGTANAERVRIDSSGNAIFTKSGGAYLQLKDASAVRGAINVETSDGLVFTTGSSFTERMRIDSSGNVGIGTTSPAQKLHVVGNQVRLDTAAGGYYLYNTSGTFRGAFYDNGTTTDIFGDGNGSTAAISIDSGNSTFAGNITSPNLNVGNAIYHDGDNNTYIWFTTDRIRIDAGGVNKFDSNNTYVIDSAPAAPTNLSLSVVNDTINVTFTASATSGIDSYFVFSSVDGGDYSLISMVAPDDFGATMSIIDNAFDATGTQAYRVYAIKNGIISADLTGSISYSVTSPLEPTNMSVVNLNTAFYIQWDAPSSNARFVSVYNVYKHEHATESSLDRASATLIYSGNNYSYMYQISGGDNNNFHKFWVETTIA